LIKTLNKKELTFQILFESEQLSENNLTDKKIHQQQVPLAKKNLFQFAFENFKM